MHDSSSCRSCSSFSGLGIDEGTLSLCRSCDVLGGGGCTACHQLKALDKEIKEAAHHLGRLLCRAFDLKSQRNRQHDRLLTTLPTEVVSRIFAYFPPRINSPSSQDYKFLYPAMSDTEPAIVSAKIDAMFRSIKANTWSVATICCSWRDAIRSIPQVWASIDVKLDRYQMDYGQFIKDWFDRSGGLPLSIRVFQKSEWSFEKENAPPAFIQLLDTINGHSARWKKLELSIPFQLLPFFTGNVSTPTSILQTIHIENCYSDTLSPDCFRMQHIQPAPSNVILKCTPMKLLDISWDQVMTMEILGCDLPDCLDVLRSVPGMTQLKFNCINIDDFPSGAQPATHGSLRSLKITETSLTDLLPLLILPDLQELFVDYTSLFIDYTSLASEVIDFVKQSGCQLTRLTIEFSYEKDTEDTERYIITLLEHIPTLQDLRLADVYLTDVFFQRLKPANSTATSGSTSLEAPTGTFLPALHTLFIDCARNFSWLSVCDIFIPASRYSSPSVKVFHLVISSDTSWGSGKVSIDRSAADFLISARKTFSAQITVICEGIDMLSAIEAEEDAK